MSNKTAKHTPFFSVILPTRNRAELLFGSALKTVLNQTMTDFEVLICDNASTDDTAERASKLRDPRITYHRSETWIPKEKFSEWSLLRATGQYVLYFFDDDALLSNALETAQQILLDYPDEVLVFNRGCSYTFPTWFEESSRNTLAVPAQNGALVRKSSRHHLANMYKTMDILGHTPMVINTFYPRDFLNGLIQKYGTILPFGHMGDYTISCYTLANTESFLYLDTPLAVYGQWEQNTTMQLRANQATMPEYQEWIAWITETMLSKMPIPTYSWPNCVAATLLDMKKQLQLPCNIGLETYYWSIQDDIRTLEVAGFDMSNQRSAFLKAYAAVPPSLKQDIVNRCDDDRTITSDEANQVLEILPTAHLYPVESGTPIQEYPITIEGSKCNFSDITSAAAYVEKRGWIDSESRREPTLPSAPQPLDAKRARFARITNLLADPQCKVLIYGANQLTRICIRISTSEIVGLIDSHPVRENTPYSTGISFTNLDALRTESFELLLVTVRIPSELKQRIQSLITTGVSPDARTVFLEDLLSTPGVTPAHSPTQNLSP